MAHRNLYKRVTLEVLRFTTFKAVTTFTLIENSNNIYHFVSRQHRHTHSPNDNAAPAIFLCSGLGYASLESFKLFFSELRPT